jgi:hypothetical protein
MDIISDDDSEVEDLMAAVALLRKRPKRLLVPKTLNDFQDYRIRSMCRFEKEDLRRLRRALLLPDRIQTRKRQYIFESDSD